MSHHRRNLFLLLSTLAGLLAWLAASPASAELRTITATGEYRMGDNDTRTDAKRLALMDAKRLALEQAGTYLESVSEVKNLQVSRDEIRTALRLDPSFVPAHFALGRMLHAKGLRTEAASEFREFLRLAPDTPGNRKHIEATKAWLRDLE